MKITFEQDHYIHTADMSQTLEPGTNPDILPELRVVVDSALYMISLYYDWREVQDWARKWEL